MENVVKRLQGLYFAVSELIHSDIEGYLILIEYQQYFSYQFFVEKFNK